MSMMAVCDGCGKHELAGTNGREWFKPHLWYERTPEGERESITACSCACIEKVEAKRQEQGKKAMTVVLPI